MSTRYRSTISISSFFAGNLAASSVLGLLLLLSVIQPDSFAQTTTANDARTFYQLAKNYADFMVEKGVDRYGETHTPAFVSMLNRETHSVYDQPREQIWFLRDDYGVREIDRSFNGTNPFNDTKLYVLLYELAEDTGRDTYRKAADRSLAWVIQHTQHPETDLIAWGDHVAWDVKEEELIRRPKSGSEWANLKHEVTGYWPLWQRAFWLAPEAMIKYARAFWKHHYYNKEDGIYAHQTRIDTGAPDKGYVFPRMVGHMIYAWTLAHYATDDASTKKEFERYINHLITKQFERRKQYKLRNLPRLHPKRGPKHAPFQNLQSIYDLQRSLDLETLPDALQEKLTSYVQLEERNFKRAQNLQPGAIVTATDPALTTVRGSRKGNKKFWCATYTGEGLYSSRALRILARYRQTDDPFYGDMVIAVANDYLGEQPGCKSIPLWPMSVARAIDLMLNAHAITGEAKYLNQAIEYGRAGIELFMDDTSPLPKVFDRGEFDHYETKSGGDELMYSFYKLSQAMR